MQDVARPFSNGRGSGKLVWRNLERALDRLQRVKILMVVTPNTIDSLLESVERLYRAGADHISLLPDLTADWSGVSEKLPRVWSQLARISLLSMLTEEPLYTAPFASYFPRTNDLYERESMHCDFAGQVAIAPSGNFYPCARLVGTDRRSDVQVGNLNAGYDWRSARWLQKCGADALRQGGCGTGGCECIALMPGDVQGQLDWSAQFARWTSQAASPLVDEIKRALDREFVKV